MLEANTKLGPNSGHSKFDPRKEHEFVLPFKITAQVKRQVGSLKLF